jgi:hypothetical protein
LIFISKMEIQNMPRPRTPTAVDPTHTVAWRTLPKNVELVPQHQDLGLQLLSRLEAVAQHADE